MVQPRFHAQVENDKKLQTVRPEPKNEILPKIGDRISLRAWLGKPYRSKQRVLREGTITAVSAIQVLCNGITFPGILKLRDHQHRQLLDGFAVLDGFSNWADMLVWFTGTHKLPFLGILIEWRPDAR